LGFGFRISGFGFRVSGFGIRVSSFGIRDSGFGIQNSSFGIWDSSFGVRVSSFGIRVSGSGFRDSGFGIRVSGAPVDRRLIALSVAPLPFPRPQHCPPSDFSVGVEVCERRGMTTRVSGLGFGKRPGRGVGVSAGGVVHPPSVLLLFFITLKPRVE